MASSLLTRIFGSRNDRLLKRYRRLVSLINAKEADVRKLTDDALRDRAQALRTGLVTGKLRSDAVLTEGFAIIRESMDRNIGIRTIFDPDSNFDPDKFDDPTLELYDSVQRRMIATGESWERVAIPVELYDAVRKLYPESRPPFRARCFDVQIIGGLVLYEGRIAEMATGEGKTFVAPLACFMRVLEGNHTHVVTVNDYLVKRDATWVKRAFEALGFSVGYIQAMMDPGDARRKAYGCDVTYGTSSEFGFDFLRDNMKERVDLQVQGPLDFVIVDEVDSILIDEARTPLIISGAAHDDPAKYRAADAVARKVLELHEPYAAVEREADSIRRQIKAAQGDEDKSRNKDDREAAKRRQAELTRKLAEVEKKKEGLTAYYEVELDKKSVHLTHEGIAAAQEVAGVGSFYVGGNMEWPHLMEQALRAHVVYEKDKEYVVERGQRTGQMEVVIVDEYTGRKMVGRQWSDGLHQAVEAKERVPIKQETQTLATITLQNFFKLYKALAGMTGTAATEAEEFSKIYKLEVVTIPTNRPRIRVDHEDRVYRTPREKWESLLDEIKLYSDAGRPVLVGTTSVEKSEMLSQMLKRKYGIEHEVLNAKNHEREAEIVAHAGELHRNAHGEMVGNVTIATNMAGRGTDIKPLPETFFDVEKAESAGKGGHRFTLKQRNTGKVIEVAPDSPLISVFELTSTTKRCGGLHVIGTERHTSRRIDNQLRGRSGRQGDPGSSRFYVSLQDDLMKLFMNDWTVNVMKRLGMGEGESIESPMITKSIIRAQKKVEERNYLARKNLLEYDEVMEHQRKSFYGMRQRVLEGREIDQVIWDMIGESIEDAVDKYITKDYVAAVVSEWSRQNFDLNVEQADVTGVRKLLDLESYIKSQARAEAETNIGVTLREYMGEDPENSADWDTKGLAQFMQDKYGVTVSQTDIRKMTSDEVAEKMLSAALARIEERDVTPLEKYLAPRYQHEELVRWAREKFGIELDVSELIEDEVRNRNKPATEIVALITERARKAYARREVEYPVDEVLSYPFGGGPATTENPYVADFYSQWIRSKFGVAMSPQEIQAMSIGQLRDRLIGLQETAIEPESLSRTVDELMNASATPDALAAAATRRFGIKVSAKDLDPPRLEASSEKEVKTHARDVLTKVARQFVRRELTNLEQFVLIQILDQSWKDHLYAMDMLKNGIGLQAFAEKDPRVIYKKEGYRFFEEMMAGVRDKVTDLIFRARIGTAQPEPKSAYRETAAIHEETEAYGVGEELAAEKAAETTTASGTPAEGASSTATMPLTREAPKVGRNDLCPCGSGKKYKKCCGEKEA